MSTLKVNNLQDINGGNNSTPSEVANGRAKAWIHMNGTGTIAIKNSYNISSITDNGSGKYTATMSITMSDTRYCVVGGGAQGTLNDNVMGFYPNTTTAFKLQSNGSTGNFNSFEDASFMSAAVFGDLA
tara:strand:+ start:336 stop:719 length:384 start_codon:yes stop_codon:yes gene_type:complete